MIPPANIHKGESRMNRIHKRYVNNNDSINIYAPVDPGGLWDRVDCKYWLRSERPEPSRHMCSVDLEVVRNHIIRHPAFTEARNVLLVDDGLSNLLRDAAVNMGKHVHNLDPLTGCVVPRLLVAELQARVSRVTLNMGSIRQLPNIDLVISGCGCYSAEGFVYSPWIHLFMARTALRHSVKLNSNTRQIVIADARQCVLEIPMPCFLRAHYIASDAGVTTFGWATLPERNADELVPNGDPIRYRIAYKQALLAAESSLFLERYGVTMAMDGLDHQTLPEPTELQLRKPVHAT